MTAFDREKLPYRNATLGIVINNSNQFLVVTHVGSGAHQWRFPGGGIEPGETPDQTILRELKEEFDTDKFKLIKQSSQIRYNEWPEDFILSFASQKRGLWRGQAQHHFLLEFTGVPEDLKPHPSEISNMKWATIDELPHLFVFDGQWPTAKLVIEELLS